MASPSSLSYNTQLTMTTAVKSLLPNHIAIIPDGNRRWAKQHNKPALEGHLAGYRNFIKIGEAAFERGVKFLTSYAFSTENWERGPEEVSYLMDLFYKGATREIGRLHKKNIRVKLLGARDGLKAKLLKAIEAAETLTSGNTGGTLAICLNYGGQAEIAEAAAAMIEAGVKPAEVTTEKFAEFLYSPEIPPVDLVIRTSGEQRLSNFMLWRSAYAEFIFSPKLWPDFDLADLDHALSEYASRVRRFGV